MQTFHFDLSTKNAVPVLNVKQGDVGRKFKAVITDGGVAYTIPTGAQFSVWFSGSSGEGNYSAIGDRSAFIVEGNSVTVELISQMLVNAGSGAMCLVLNAADGSQLGLWNIIYGVEHVPGMGSKAAEDYYTALSELARQAIDAAATFETDSTLSVSGKAADAVAVGAGLAGKAPAGYGYGEYCAYKSWADADGTAFENYVDTTFTENGKVYRLAELATYPACLVSGNGGYADIHAGFEGEGCLIVGHFYGNGTGLPYLAAKEKMFSKWYPWEYVNPPMELGVEYRTTERWNGKAVYTKLIDCGYLPANSIQNVKIGTVAETGITHPVGCSAVAVVPSYPNHDFSILPAFGDNGEFVAGASFTARTIDGERCHVVTLTTGYDWSMYKAYATIRYTKD